MNNRKIPILISIALILFSVLVVFVFLFRSKEVSQRPVEPTPTPYPTYNRVPTVPLSPIQPVTAGKISLLGVTLNNPAVSPVSTNTAGDILSVDNSQFQIVYFPSASRFLISILGSPFDSIRIAAEKEFLIRLDITQADACKLNVKETTPNFANPAQAGQEFPLSFCGK